MINSESPEFKNAMMNNTFDLNVLEEVLFSIKAQSFGQLYESQLATAGYKRHDFRMSDLKKISRAETIYPKKYVYHLETDFINEQKRLEYRRSKFFGKEISVSDIPQNPNIFANAYMVFIDGRFYDTINLKCDEDHTQIIFDIYEVTNQTGIPENHFNDLLTQDAQITVLIVPNCAFGVYNTNIYMLEKYKDNLALDRFNIINNLETDTEYITFINANDLLYASVITDTTNSADILRFYNNPVGSLTKYVHLNVFGFRNLLDQLTITPGDKFFSIEQQKAPIPAENLMVFRNSDGKKYFDHNVSVKYYYPNYYELIGSDPDTEYTIYVFYFQDTTKPGEEFISDTTIYNDALEITPDDYLDGGRVSAFAKDYMPPKLNYSIKNFENYDGYADSFQYKIDKLREWININPALYTHYLNKQVEKFGNYYIECSKVDLPSKVRVNNHTEVGNTAQQKTFDSSRYVFIFRNKFIDDPYKHYKIFIDGEYYLADEMYSDKKFVFVYIPVSKVTSSTVIEVELFNAYDFSATVTFENTIDVPKIEFTTSVNVNASDVFLVDENGVFIPQSLYKIMITCDEVDVELPEGSMQSIGGSIKLRALDESIVGKEITVYIREHLYSAHKEIVNESDLDFVFLFPTKTQGKRERFRIFRNNRLIPICFNGVVLREHLDDIGYGGWLIEREIGDVYHFEQTPYIYKEVFYVQDLHERGFVDLRGIINKPFDLKWYDVYLNGRKLNKTHIEKISPFLLIIKNVQSRKNLLIIEKNRDAEYFTFGTNQTIMDTLWDDSEELKDSLMSRPIIDDIEENIITRIFEEYSIEMKYLYETYFKSGGDRFINPDTVQITPEMRIKYPLIMGNNSVVMLNPDKYFDARSTLKIYPEIE